MLRQKALVKPAQARAGRLKHIGRTLPSVRDELPLS